MGLVLIKLINEDKERKYTQDFFVVVVHVDWYINFRRKKIKTSKAVHCGLIPNLAVYSVKVTLNSDSW